MHHRPITDVMNRDVVTAGPDLPFRDLAALLAEHRISGVPVVDSDGKVLGMVSERDLVARQAARPDRSGEQSGERPLRRLLRPLLRGGRAHRSGGRAATAAGLMTRPAVTIGPRRSIAEAARVMDRSRCNRLPVIDAEGRLMGIVTRGDLLGVFLRSDHDIRKEVVEEVLVRTLWLEPNAIDVSVHGGVVALSGTLQRRSDVPLTVRFVSRIDGVVDVLDHLGYEEDDSRLRPSEQALHGITEEWLRRL